jgi:hypothetical protein
LAEPWVEAPVEPLELELEDDVVPTLEEPPLDDAAPELPPVVDVVAPLPELELPPVAEVPLEDPVEPSEVEPALELVLEPVPEQALTAPASKRRREMEERRSGFMTLPF